MEEPGNTAPAVAHARSPAPRGPSGSIDGDKVAKLQQLIDRTAHYSQLLKERTQVTVTYGVEEDQAGQRGQRGKKAAAGPQQGGGDLAGKLNSLAGDQKEAARVLQPPTVTGGQLRSYQLDALNWLIGHFENGINAVLADEMGLGKTITTIALLGHLWHMGVRGPFLVVAPVSTLSNWTGEFARWAPVLPVLLYHGSPEEREQLRLTLLQMTKRPPPRAAIKLSTPKRRKTAAGAAAPVSEALAEAMKNKQLPIVVTSYEIAIKDVRFLRQHRWKYLIVDEAHRLKNFECKLICELRTLQTDSRLLLTGTPLQNNLAELWSLLNFLLPDIFANLGDFKQWFDFTELLEKNGEGSGSEDSGQLHADLVAKLHSLMRPFLLRRLKQDVEVGLPKKQEVVVFAGTTPTQRALYDAIKNKSLKLRSVSLNNLVMQLRKVCNHPYLFAEDIIKRVFEHDENEHQTTEEATPAPQDAADEQEDTEGMYQRLRSRKRGASVQEKHYTELADEEEDQLDDDEFERHLLSSCVEHSKPEEKTAPKEDAPRRRKSAYNLFSAECWAQVRLSGRKLERDEVPQITVDIAGRWANMAADERAVYEARLEEEERAQNDLLTGGSVTRLRTPEELAAVSGKMALLHRMLPELHRRGHRVLLFSQMTRVLDLLEEYVQQAGYTYCRIDGSIAQADRKQQIEQFTKDNIFAFLLSTRAGGQGINLMAADTVIIYDSDWNPQMDMQAMDRCHRIGQTKPVVVYRLITANTVDSKILQRAREKLMLERLVVGKGAFSRKQTNSTLTEEELRDMLKWRAGEGGERAVTEDELSRLLDRQQVFADVEAMAKEKASQEEAHAEQQSPAPQANLPQEQAVKQEQHGPAPSPSPSQSITPAPESAKPSPPGFLFVTSARGQL